MLLVEVPVDLCFAKRLLAKNPVGECCFFSRQTAFSDDNDGDGLNKVFQV